jgi:hypothetical protein
VRQVAALTRNQLGRFAQVNGISTSRARCRHFSFLFSFKSPLVMSHL